MKKKLLIAAPLLILVGVIGYQVSSALFRDTEKSGSNTFEAGTLDMSVNGANGTAFESFEVKNIGADGVVSGTKTWTIINSGTVPGNLNLSLLNVLNHENGCNEPEAIVDTTCADPGTGEGELGVAVVTKVSLDKGSGFQQLFTSDLVTANQGQYAGLWNTNAGVVTVGAGQSVKVKMDWATDPTLYGNEVQSDGLDFDVQFDLVQVTPV